MSADVIKNPEQTLDIVKAIEEFAKFIEEAKGDGKLDLADGLKALKLVPVFVAAIKGAEAVPSELANLNGEQKDQLIVAFSQGFVHLVAAIA